MEESPTSRVIATNINSVIEPLTPTTIAIVAILLLILFGVAIAVFFVAFNQPAMHNITVLNNCTQNINIIFGVISGVNGTEDIGFLNERQLAPGQAYTYRASPGVSIIVQGYRPGDTVVPHGVNPFTTVELTLAGQGYAGSHQITDGETISLTNLTNTNVDDWYDVSIQGGYNLPVTIVSTGFNNRDPQDRSSCVGPNWNHAISENVCPDELQAPGTGPDYQVCLAPCTAIGGSGFCCTNPTACTVTGGCQTLWPTPDYYTIFKNSCPNCLVTNCETSNFYCGSQGGLTQYLITFCAVPSS